MITRISGKIASIALAALLGWVFSELGLPLAWVIGPLIGTAALSLPGYSVFADLRARKAGQIAVGAAIGLNLTAASLQALWLWVPVAILCNVAALLLALGFGRLFARLMQTDPATGYFAMVPGGLSEMANIADGSGGQMEVVAILQALRVATTVCILPPLILWLDLHGSFDIDAATGILPPTGTALVVLFGTATAFLARKLGLNNPWLIGALVGASVLTVSGLVSGHLPRWLFCLGQMMIGMSIGARFKLSSLRMIAARIHFALLLLIAMMALMAVLSALFAWLSGFDLASSILALSPGGFSEMATTSTMLHLNTALVTVFHVSRAFIINGFAATFWQYFGPDRMRTDLKS